MSEESDLDQPITVHASDARGLQAGNSNLQVNVQVVNGPAHEQGRGAGGLGSDAPTAAQQAESPATSGPSGHIIDLGGRLRLPGFAGREQDLVQLRNSLVNRGASALVQAVTGLGGVGKTRLAVEYAYQYADDYDLVVWLRAETNETLLADFCALASHLGLPQLDKQDQAVAAVQRALSDHPGGGRHAVSWLLIVDNATDDTLLKALLPAQHHGHVLVTTRRPDWPGARCQKVDILPLSDAVAMMTTDTAVTEQEAEVLAEALGCLPLALTQAIAVIKDGVSAREYALLLRERAPELFRLGEVVDYEHTVATTWQVSFDRLADHPTAVALLRVCSFLAPDSIPLARINPTTVPAVPAPVESPPQTPERPKLPEGLFSDPLTRSNACAALRRTGLAETTNALVNIHRLVQHVTRLNLGPDEQAWACLAQDLILMVFPDYPDDDPATWPACEELLPHLRAATTYAQALDPLTAVRLLTRAGAYLHARGRFDLAETVAADAEALVSGVPKTVDTELATLEVHHLQALLNHDRGAYDAAKSLYDQVLAARTRILGADHRDTLRTRGSLASTLGSQGSYASARSVEERVLAARERVLGPDHRDTIHARGNLANTLFSEGDYKTSRAMQEQSLADLERVLGPDHPDTIRARSSLATILHAQSEYSTARHMQEQVLADRERILGPDHPDTIHSRGALATTLYAQGDYPTARQIEEQVLADRERVLGPDHPDTIHARSSLATTLYAQGEQQLAREMEEQVLADRERVLGPDHPDTISARANLAITLFNRGDYATARQIEEQVLADRERVLGPVHPDTIQARGNLATTLANTGDRKTARKMLHEALEQAIRLLGSRHELSTSFAWSLAQLYTRSRNHNGAMTTVMRHLRWLTTADRSSLSGHQQTTREEVMTFLHGGRGDKARKRQP